MGTFWTCCAVDWFICFGKPTPDALFSDLFIWQAQAPNGFTGPIKPVYFFKDKLHFNRITATVQFQRLVESLRLLVPSLVSWWSRRTFWNSVRIFVWSSTCYCHKSRMFVYILKNSVIFRNFWRHFWSNIWKNWSNPQGGHTSFAKPEYPKKKAK